MFNDTQIIVVGCFFNFREIVSLLKFPKMWYGINAN